MGKHFKNVEVKSSQMANFLPIWSHCSKHWLGIPVDKASIKNVPLKFLYEFSKEIYITWKINYQWLPKQ